MAALDLTSRASTQDTAHRVYTLAVIVALLSFSLILLIIPPIFWHARNRNIGATALASWLLLLLLFTFVNAIIWPSDDVSSWFNGVGLCDIEVKIQVASWVGLPAAFACILRALAAVMDTERATFTQTQAQRRRNYAIDLACCVGFPLLQMPLHYIVQTRRYYIYGIAGCTPAFTISWLTIPLLILPPALWTIFDAYLAVLILVRLYRYRLSFSNIIASSTTTKSRFVRLYALCSLWIVATVPLQLYVMFDNVMSLTDEPYNWSSVHNPEAWKQLVMIPSGGKVAYDRWLWLTAAFAVFAFFGFGGEAKTMYRMVLLAIGVGHIFPSLRNERRTSIATTITSFSSRARMVFKLRSFSSTSDVDTQTTSRSDGDSPRKSTYLGTSGGLEPVSEKACESTDDVQTK